MIDIKQLKGDNLPIVMDLSPLAKHFTDKPENPIEYLNKLEHSSKLRPIWSIGISFPTYEISLSDTTSFVIVDAGGCSQWKALKLIHSLSLLNGSSGTSVERGQGKL